MGRGHQKRNNTYIIAIIVSCYYLSCNYHSTNRNEFLIENRDTAIKIRFIMGLCSTTIGNYVIYCPPYRGKENLYTYEDLKKLTPLIKVTSSDSFFQLSRKLISDSLILYFSWKSKDVPYSYRCLPIFIKSRTMDTNIFLNPINEFCASLNLDKEALKYFGSMATYYNKKTGSIRSTNFESGFNNCLYFFKDEFAVYTTRIKNKIVLSDTIHFTCKLKRYKSYDLRGKSN